MASPGKKPLKLEPLPDTANRIRAAQLLADLKRYTRDSCSDASSAAIIPEPDHGPLSPRRSPLPARPSPRILDPIVAPPTPPPTTKAHNVQQHQPKSKPEAFVPRRSTGRKSVALLIDLALHDTVPERIRQSHFNLPTLCFYELAHAATQPTPNIFVGITHFVRSDPLGEVRQIISEMKRIELEMKKHVQDSDCKSSRKPCSYVIQRWNVGPSLYYISPVRCDSPPDNPWGPCSACRRGVQYREPEKCPSATDLNSRMRALWKKAPVFLNQQTDPSILAQAKALMKEYWSG